MERLFFCLIIFMLSFNQDLSAQEKKGLQRFSIEVGFGAAYSFFVKYEQPLNEVPSGFISFYDKNRLGNIGAFELKYHFNKKNLMGLAYTRQNHFGKKNFVQQSEGSQIVIRDFKIRHTNNFFELYYGRKVFNKGNFFLLAGVYVLNPEQQEISIFNNMIEIEERNSANAHLQEGGLMMGLKYQTTVSGNFSVGIESKIYFTASTGELETLSIVPKLSYGF